MSNSKSSKGNITVGSPEYVRDKIFGLIDHRCVSQRTLADDIGVSEYIVSKWKNGHSRSFMSKIGQIAKYLNVPVEALTGINTQDNPDNDEEIREYLEELKSRSEMRTLFKISKGATKEDIEKTIDILKTLKK